MSFNSSKISINPTVNHVVISIFNAITSVSSNNLTTILSYTVPILKNTFIELIEFSGSNIATYEIYINSILRAKQRTQFGASLNGTFLFKTSTSDIGLELNAGDILEVKVIHPRPYIGDFEARMLAIEQG